MFANIFGNVSKESKPNDRHHSFFFFLFLLALRSFSRLMAAISSCIWRISSSLIGWSLSLSKSSK